jgi:diguanylate cyclase (GGDEF)-like protein/PAS domain S-box-containing protein
LDEHSFAIVGEALLKSPFEWINTLMSKAIPFLLRRPLCLALVVLMIGLIISTIVVLAQEQNRQQAKRDAVSQIANNHLFLIRSSLDQAMAVNYSMGTLVRLTNGTARRFEDAARELLPYFGSVSHVALSPNGVITHVYPLAGNEKSVGFNPLTDPAQGEMARMAVETRQMTLAAPVNLVQGGLGVIARLPIFLDTSTGNEFWGFSSVIIRVDKLLEQANFNQLDTQIFAYELSSKNPKTGMRDIIKSNQPQLLKDPLEKAIQVPNGQWILTIQPINGWSNNLQILTQIFLGLVISGLVSYLSFLLVRLQYRKLTLQDAVAEQTREVMNARTQLQATLDAIPDLLFDIDLTGIIHNYHTNRQELLTVSPDRFLGQNFREFLPEHAVEIVDDALHEALEKGVSSGKCYSLQLPRGSATFELSVSRKTYEASKSRFVVLARDITERRLTEAELRVAATAFEAREGMMITDPDGNILRINKAFTEVTGFTAEDVVGKTPRILSSGRHDKQFYDQMWKSILSEGSWRGEIWNRRSSGEIFPEWLTITAVKNEQGIITHFVSTLTDISELKEHEERIHNLAFFDPLTHLPNRRLLQDRLEHAMTNSIRQHTKGALLFIDLDDFKTLNDNRGHHVGDLLLIAVAERLRLSVREQDTVARLGGDEFVVVLEGLSEARDEAAAQTQLIAEKILAQLNSAYDLEGQGYFNTPSMGICLFGDHHVPIEEILKQADQAMYHAKASGRNTFRFFDPEMQASATQRFKLQHEMREALQKNQFQLFYQPQINADGKVIGAEALIRWIHPQRGMVPPMEFIPIAEDSGLILPLGKWIVETACQQLVSWSKNSESAHLILAINVSARQFQQANFVEQLLMLVRATGADPHKLKLELTESMLVDNPQDIITKMDALKIHGIQFSLDDFGTGYSSLSYLKRLPINELKIDKSFVNDILTDPNDASIARMIIRLAQSMELKVIAEGVETKEQRDWLESEGCFKYQGYYFGRPVPVDQFQV